MYRHGLGDCFLLRLPRDDGRDFNMLIDCGLIGVAENPKNTMAQVLSDIKDATGGHLDCVVMTHEHWDHCSGFSTEQAQAAFNQLDISEVWYAWTEDPENELGRRLRKERESKLRALNRAVAALSARATPLAMLRAQHITSVLDFFGGPEPQLIGAPKARSAGRTRPAFEYLAQRAGVKRRYCYPTSDPIAFPDVSCARVYVLGPPENESLIKRSAPTKAKEVYEFAAGVAIDDNLSAAFERLQTPSVTADGKDCPFDQTYSRPVASGALEPPGSARLQSLFAQSWNANGEQWRQIEEDWTAAAENLALNLDTHTNNTSLVLAIELIPSGRVLLFAADAQVGHWLSWQELRWRVNDRGSERLVNGPDLLRRTVFYKVGHHGSHNATLRALGLEQMTSGDLIAFIPVFVAQAQKNRWMGMPFSPLVQRLREKANGRVVVSDRTQSAPTDTDLQSLSQKQRTDFAHRLTADELFYEYAVEI